MQLRFYEGSGEFVTTIPFNAPFTLQKGVGAVALSVSPNGLPAPPAGEPRGSLRIRPSTSQMVSCVPRNPTATLRAALLPLSGEVKKAPLKGELGKINRPGLRL